MPTVKGALRRLRGAPLPVPGGRGWRTLSTLSAPAVLDVVYELVLRREPDPTIEKIVAGWSRDFDARRGVELGFKAETSFDEIIRVHIEDELGGKIG